MYKLSTLTNKIKELFDKEISSIDEIGSGISGKVYKITMSPSNFKVAVKVAKDGALLQQESDYIKFISDKVDIKLPRIYYTYIEKNNNFMIMEFFDGVACSDEKVLNANEEIRNNIAQEIADNIAKLQTIKGEKYGNLLNPQYDNWHDYYKPFVENMINSAYKLIEENILIPQILTVMKLAYANYDNIFDEPISKPTLIHGDYWASNIIVDKNFHLQGVVDPFNAIWADSEYELFALNAVYGEKLPVLEAFIKKNTLSKKFAVKNECYILFSEVYWVTIMKHDNNNYLTEITNRLITQMKNYNII